MTVPIADRTAGIIHVFIRDMVMPASIGVLPHEHAAPQRVRINVDLAVKDIAEEVGPDEVGRVVDYGKIAAGVRSIVAAGHIRLVETLAERIAASCLTDDRVERVRVRVEKLEILADAVSAGVEIERLKRSLST